MNQYTTKIWKYDSDTLSAIQFEFLNGSSIYYDVNSNGWSGVDKHQEPMRLSRVYAVATRYGLFKEVDSMSLDCPPEARRDTSEGAMTHDKNNRTHNEEDR